MKRFRSAIASVLGLALLTSLAAPLAAGASMPMQPWTAPMVSAVDGVATATVDATVSASTAAGVRFTPRTINTRAKGRWVKAVIRIAATDASVSVDPASITISAVNGQVATLTPSAVKVVAVDTSGTVLVARFSRSDLASLLIRGRNTITVTGTLSDGTGFSATDTVKAVGPKAKAAKMHDKKQHGPKNMKANGKNRSHGHGKGHSKGHK